MMTDKIALLVVEDDALIRIAIACELADSGFEVFEASSSDAAIAVLIANQNIQVMFTDVDMLPGISGLRLASIVRSRWPPIKIIVTSGAHTVTPDMMPTMSTFLQKPYAPSQVLAAISEMTTV